MFNGISCAVSDERRGRVGRLRLDDTGKHREAAGFITHYIKYVKTS